MFLITEYLYNRGKKTQKMYHATEQPSEFIRNLNDKTIKLSEVRIETYNHGWGHYNTPVTTIVKLC